jgi:gamma-glutamyltranspeptidase/glutathione hydrolase
MHTIIPGMVTKLGKPVMPFGVMGGHFQPMGQSLFLSNMFDYGLDIQEALDLPRFFHYAGNAQVEQGVRADVTESLARLGHTIERMERPLGGGQAIWIDHDRGCFIGGSDCRKDGLALGY